MGITHIHGLIRTVLHEKYQIISMASPKELELIPFTHGFPVGAQYVPPAGKHEMMNPSSEKFDYTYFISYSIGREMGVEGELLLIRHPYVAGANFRVGIMSLSDRRRLHEMQSSLPDGVAKTDKSKLLIAAYRAWPIWERGLLIFDETGICYKPIARSVANIIAVILIVIWILFGVLAAVSGGFVGFFWNLLVIGLIFVILSIISSGLRKRASIQEQQAKAGQLDTISELSGAWFTGWKDVRSVSIGATRIVLLFEHKKQCRFQLLAKASALDFENIPEVVQALRNAIAQFAPDKMS